MSSRRTRHSATARRLNKHGVAALLREVSQRKAWGVAVHSVQVSDGYDTRRYGLERLLFHRTAAVMNRYLAKRPQLEFEHRRNLVRHALYRLPSFAKWSRLMDSQGSLAMEPLHNPEVRRLASGDRLGPVTRRLFRHGADPVGIRSRTITAGWLAGRYVAAHPDKPIKWLSLAGGSATHAMFMVDVSGVDKAKLAYADIDANHTAIELAAGATQLAGLDPARTRLLAGDVFDERLLAEAGCGSGVDIIDMMGILEYLDERQAAHLVRLAYARLAPGGVILTCNMRRSHPQLHLHKRGVGWPGVVPRTAKQLVGVCQAGGVRPAHISLYQPLDGVYNIARLEKG